MSKSSEHQTNDRRVPIGPGAAVGIVLAFVAFSLAIGIVAERATDSVLQSASASAPAAEGPVWLVLLAVAGLIGLNALFVAAETSIELLRAHHVKLLREERPKEAERLQALLDGQAGYAAACALGSQTVRLAIVFLILLGVAPAALLVLIERFQWANTYPNLLLVALGLMAPIGAFHLVFGELVPKSYAALHPQRVASLLHGFVLAAATLFSPGAKAVTALAQLLTRRFGGRASFAVPNAAEEEILTLVETAEETGEIESGERELLESVFDFTDTVVREIMTPRVDLDALPVRSDPMEVVRVIQESGHSRIPLYEDTDDQIVGVIHAKDLLLAMLNGKAPNLRKLMRPALFVPENKNLYELITEMRLHRTQLAIVQDEFGGTAGIVTIEDIVEELVGEIVDEYDVEEPEVVPGEEGWLISGKTHLDDVNEVIGSALSSEEFDTIGGYVFGLFGRQPRPGDEIEADGFRFVVVETDGRRIGRLRVEKLPERSTPEAEHVER